MFVVFKVTKTCFKNYLDFECKSDSVKKKCNAEVMGYYFWNYSFKKVYSKLIKHGPYETALLSICNKTNHLTSVIPKHV